MKHYLSRRSTLLAAAMLALFPFGSTSTQAQDRLNEVNPRVKFSSVSRAYPDMDARYARTGTPRSIAQVKTIEVGQSQASLQAVFGRPAIRNGDGSHEYHLSLPLTQRDRLICQYRVFFDGHDKVERAVWRRPQCADLVVGNAN